MFFVVLGIASLLWLIPWLKLMPRADPNQVTSTQALPGIFEMLKHRSSWGTFGGHFCGNYFWYFLLTWAPIYLVKERHFSIGEMANLTSIVFLVVAISTIVAGWISDRLISRGKSPTVVRKSIVVGGLTLATIIFPVAFVTSVTTSIVLLIISCIGYGVYASNHWAITQTIAGSLMAGRWTSVQNGVGNISGIIGPSLAGWIVQTSGSSGWAFAICALVSLSGALLWGLIVGPVEQVQWSTRSLS
jgi:MFS family permease